MKKLGLLLVAVFMACLTLTACQGKDYEDGNYVLNEIFILNNNKTLVETGNKIINKGKFELKGITYA